MSSFIFSIKILQNIFRKHGLSFVSRTPQLPGRALLNGTASGTDPNRSLSQDTVERNPLHSIGKARDVLPLKLQAQIVLIRSPLFLLRGTNNNPTCRAFSTSQGGSKSNPECGLAVEECDTARPMKSSTDSSACRRARGCTPAVTDHCDCEPRNKPRPPPNKMPKCPPKLHEDVRCPTKFKLPVATCTLPESIRCGIAVSRRISCKKIEAPIPSFSECLRALVKPAPPSSECRLTDKFKFLQPRESIFVSKPKFETPPEVETFLNPCRGLCCKLIVKDGNCPARKNKEKVRCMFMGKKMVFEGCDLPVNLDCDQPSTSRPCNKPRAPVPSFSECIKQDFRRLPYTECSVAMEKAKTYADLQSQGKVMTVEIIDATKCFSDEHSWNCSEFKASNITCPPTSAPVDCRSGKHMSKSNECKPPKECDAIPYKKGST